MEKRRRGRPRADYPYICGPYKQRRRWKLVIVTGRSRGRRESYARAFDTREQAQTWSREFRRQRAAAGRTVKDAVDAYLENLRRKGNKEGSIKTAGYRLAALLDYSMALIDLTPRRAQDLYDDLVDEGVAVDTHRGCLVSGRAFGRFCMSKSWLHVNPFAKVEPVGRKAKGKEQLRIDEARTYMTYCLKTWNEKRDRSAIAGLLALVFSMRASEVAQLVARDVDDRGRILHIAAHDAKTIASKRAAKVPAILTPVLLELADNPATPDGHLFSKEFSKEANKPADRHWVLYWARYHMAAAGVTVVTAHGLRGTSATIGTVQTGGAEVMASALGHTSTSMTKAHYIDAGATADAQAERVADLLPNPNDTDGV
jgi:integrase